MQQCFCWQTSNDGTSLFGSCVKLFSRMREIHVMQLWNTDVPLHMAHCTPIGGGFGFLGASEGLGTCVDKAMGVSGAAVFLLANKESWNFCAWQLRETHFTHARNSFHACEKFISCMREIHFTQLRNTDAPLHMANCTPIGVGFGFLGASEGVGTWVDMALGVSDAAVFLLADKE